MEVTLESVLKENNPLLVAFYLTHNPLPESEEDRIKLLTILGAKGIFDISYKSLYATSEAMNEKYPLASVYKLLSSLDGSKPYKEQINASTEFTKEEKALLNFITPI